MFQYDDPTVAATLPTPAAAGTAGYFTNGSAGSGTPATILTADFMNAVMLELLNVVTASGATPSKTSQSQILTAMKSMFSPAVGTVRNLVMSITAASATATLTADEITVETALGGTPFKLASFNKTINLATTGAGGMDTGTAPTSGFVALYAIYNPTTQTSALLATNAATLQPNVYGGANLPAGYTASALVSVWPTNASKQFIVGYQNDRSIKMLAVTMLGTSTAAGSLTSLSIAGAVPLNAKTVSGTVGITFTTTAGTQLSCAIASSSSALGQQVVGVGGAASTVNTINGVFADLNLVTAQTVFYIFSFGGGTGQSLVVQANGYTF